MSDFDRALAIIFEVEGYDKVIVDSGGLTKWGISQRAYPDLDIRALTKADAAALYRRDYWDAVKGDELPWPLSCYVFDAAVNHGADPARRMLQKALGGLRTDGIIGRRTLARVREADLDETCALFMAQRCLRYSGTRHFDRYGYGWFARLFRVVRKAS